MNQPWTAPGEIGTAVTRLDLDNAWVRAATEAGAARTRRRPLRHAALAFVTTLLACAGAYRYLPQRYEASAALYLRPTDNDGQADRSLRQPLDENALQSEIDFVSSPVMADAVIGAHGLDNDAEFVGPGRLRSLLPPDWLPPARPTTRADLRRTLADHLQVIRDRRSYTVRLGFWSADPGKAAAMTGTLLSAYLDAQRARKRAALSGLTEWLKERADTLTAHYKDARRRIDDYLVAHSLLDTGAQVELDQRLQVLTVEEAQARARLIEASARVRALAAMKEAGTLDQAQEVLSSPAILKLKDGLAAALSRTAVWSSETEAIERQIKAEVERIVAAASVEAQGWETRETMLRRQVAEIREAIAHRRASEREAAELQRVADSERTLMEESLAKLKGMTARTEVVEPDAIIISEPEIPADPSFPKPLPTALAALGLALLASFAACWREVAALVGRLVQPDAAPKQGRPTVRATSLGRPEGDAPC